jgi:hypothetical protein
MAHLYELSGYAGTKVEFSDSPESRSSFTIAEAPVRRARQGPREGNRALIDQEHPRETPEQSRLGSVPFSELALAGVIRTT